jgi:predicted glycoside hydrolase/deacetylase ChbG (UPF0249 family)
LNQLDREIGAQLHKFKQTRLVLDHVNGHLNLHLHPTVFKVLLKHAGDEQITTMRLTHDPLRLNLRLARGRYGYRLSHALVFGMLSRWARGALRRRQIRHTAHVFGLLQTGWVDKRYVLELLAALPVGDSELYSHPCLDKFKSEYDALVSPKVRQAVQQHGIQLVRYQDL